MPAHTCSAHASVTPDFHLTLFSDRDARNPENRERQSSKQTTRCCQNHLSTGRGNNGRRNCCDVIGCAVMHHTRWLWWSLVVSQDPAGGGWVGLAAWGTRAVSGCKLTSCDEREVVCRTRSCFSVNFEGSGSGKTLGALKAMVGL